MPRFNKCPNPALANNATGWSTNGTGARTAVTGFARPWAFRASTSATYVQGPAVPAAAGEVWTVSADVRSTVAIALANSRSVYVDCFSSVDGTTGYLTSLGTVYAVNADEITRIRGSATLPANTASIRPIFEASSSASTFDVTMAVMEKGNVLGGYIDGDTLGGGSWDGTAGSSTSTFAGGETISALHAMTRMRG